MGQHRKPRPEPRRRKFLLVGGALFLTVTATLATIHLAGVLGIGAPARAPGYDIERLANHVDVPRSVLEMASIRAPGEALANGAHISFDMLLLWTYSDPAGAVEQMRTQGFQPRSYLSPVALETPVDWAQDPFDDVNWRFQLNAWRMNDARLQDFEENGSIRSFEEAVGYALDWSRSHQNPAQRRANAFSWYDFAAGARAQQLAFMLSAAAENHTLLTDDELAALLNLAAEHAHALRAPGFILNSNHAIHQVHGLAALCAAAPGLEACGSGHAPVPSLFSNVVASQFAPDGAHLEHSPGYHFFALELLERAAGHGLYGSAPIEALERARAAANWLVRPDGRLPPVGDTDPVPTFESFAPEPCPDDQSELDCLETRVFPQGGVAIARTRRAPDDDRGAHVYLQAAHHSRTHKHADTLTVEWFDRGRPILTEAGRFAYDDGPARRYVISTPAHTTIEFDDRSQPTGDDVAFGSAVSDSIRTPWGVALSARYRDPLSGAEAVRTLLFSPGDFLVVVDRIEPGRARRFTRWFHAAADLTAEDRGGELALLNGDDVVAVMRSLSPQCQLRSYRGERSPRMNGWSSPDYREIEPAPAIAEHCAARTAVYATVFAFDDQGLNTGEEAFRAYFE